MFSKEAIVQIIYSTVKIESLIDSVEDAAEKIMELAQQTNNKPSTSGLCHEEVIFQHRVLVYDTGCPVHGKRARRTLDEHWCK